MNNTIVESVGTTSSMIPAGFEIGGVIIGFILVFSVLFPIIVFLFVLVRKGSNGAQKQKTKEEKENTETKSSKGNLLFLRNLIIVIAIILFSVWSVTSLFRELRVGDPSNNSSSESKEQMISGGSSAIQEIIAPVDSWTDPIVVPANKEFIWDCSGCESGNRIEVMVNGEVITDGETNWYDLSQNLEPPVSIRFKANDTEAKVWFSVTSK